MANFDKNPYIVLGLENFASLTEIKKSYRKLALRYHPDRNKDLDAEEKFKEIANAYDLIKDDDSKRVYDEKLRTGNVSEMPFSDDSDENDWDDFWQNLYRKRSQTQYTGNAYGNSFTENQRKTRSRFGEAFLKIFDAEQYFSGRTTTYADLDKIPDSALEAINSPLWISALENYKLRIHHLTDASHAITLILTPECLQAISSYKISIRQLKDIPYEKLVYLLSPEFIKGYKGVFSFSSFNLSELKTYSVETLALLKTPGYIELLTLPALTWETIDSVLNLKNTKSAEWFELLLSPSCHAAINEKTFEFQQLKNLSADAFALILQPERLAIFKQIKDEKLIDEPVLYLFSKEELQRILTPTYVKALQQMKKESGSEYPFHHLGRDDYQCKKNRQNPVVFSLLNSINFESILDHVKRLKDSHSDANHKNAAEAAGLLYERLLAAQQKFIESNDPIQAQKVFISECKQAVKLARPELEKHRGWKKVFADIANALVLLLTIGLSYPVTGRYTLFDTQTNSAAALDRIDSKIKIAEDDINKKFTQ